MEIETHSKTSGGEDAPRIVKLKKLRAACEEKLKKLRAGYKAYQRWREANKSRNCATRGVGRPSVHASTRNADERIREAGGEKTKKYKKYGIKDKVRALDMLAKGKKLVHVAKIFRTRKELIRYWRKREAQLRQKMEARSGDDAKLLNGSGRKAKAQELGGNAPATLEPGKHHKCGKCDKQFKTGIELRIHRRRRHGGRVQGSFTCDECNLVFTHTGHLARHKLTHTGAKPFECETCHKGFSRQDKLRIHLLVHSDERPFACAKCGYRYATMVGLQLHRRIHRAAQCDKALK
ncbi:hypothetical protein AAVH_25656 [Aphelenchoides avenae]|nr:hypothetical protein AAVH_25656 [Aphelenchus avenae]